MNGLPEVSTLTAFLAGVLSFVSPCVLPLVPAYLTFVSGVSLEEIREGEDRRRVVGTVVLSTLLFILGFSVVFVLLGASTSLFLGKLFLLKRGLFRVVMGLVVIVLGLHLAGLFRIGALDFEKRLHHRERPLGMTGAFLVGIAFAFGWSPCIGPILAGILGLASSHGTLRSGIYYLLVYSIGLGIPFLLAALATNAFLAVSQKVRKHMRAVELASGVLLAGIGLLILTDNLSVLSGWLARVLPETLVY